MLYWPPERICVIDFAIDDFSATQSTIIPAYRSRSEQPRLHKAKHVNHWTVPGESSRSGEVAKMDLATPVKVIKFVKKARCGQTVRPELQEWWEGYLRQRYIGAV